MIRTIHNIAGTNKFINDLGIEIFNGDIFDLSNFLPMEYIYQTNDLFNGITSGYYTLEVDGDLIITDATVARQYFAPLTETSLADVTSKSLTLRNPNDMQYVLIANSLNVCFQQHYEKMYMESQLQNTFVTFGTGYNKLNTYSNIASINGNWQLDLNSSGTSLEDCSNITNVTEAGIIANGSISLNTNASYYKSSSGSWKIDYDSGYSIDEYILRKAITSANWNGYKWIRIWIYGAGGEYTQFYLNDALVPNSWVILKTGWQLIQFDISTITRTAITSYAIGIIPNLAAIPFDVYIDDVIGLATSAVYYSSGSITFNTITTSYDITHVFVYPYESTSSTTNIIYKISLDGGTTWHTLGDAELNLWVLVSGWAESFNNKKNLVFKVDFSTTNTANTPLLDDCFIMYKLA